MRAIPAIERPRIKPPSDQRLLNRQNRGALHERRRQTVDQAGLDHYRSLIGRGIRDPGDENTDIPSPLVECVGNDAACRGMGLYGAPFPVGDDNMAAFRARIPEDQRPRSRSGLGHGNYGAELTGIPPPIAGIGIGTGWRTGVVITAVELL